MRLGFLALAVTAAILTSPFAAQAKPAAVATTEKAKSYAEDVATEALDTINSARDGKISNKDARIKFRKILNDRFDVPTIAKFTMGRYWRVATEAEQKEFVRLLQVTILDKYADRMLEYSGDGYKIGEASAINDKDYGVTMNVLPKGKAPVAFALRLRDNGKGNFKIIDIAVEGISMSVTHRTDFASVIERNGGKVKALLDALKNKEFSK